MEQLSFTQNMAFQPAAVVAAGAVSSGPKVPAARATASGSERHSASGFGGNVTEIILPEEQVENFQLLLPMLTQLNQEKRWLAWIDPPQSLEGR